MKSIRRCYRFWAVVVAVLPYARAQTTLFAPGSAVGLSSNGNVGIGTTAPTAKLEIDSSSGNVTLRLKNTSVATNWDFSAYSDGNFYLNNGNGAVVSVSSSAAAGLLYLAGNRVGIGTSNLFRPLSVEAGGAAGTNQGLVINSSHAFGAGQGVASASLVFSRNRNVDISALNVSGQIVGGNESETTSNNGFLSFQTTNSAGTVVEAMRIDSSGSVGIGISTPTSYGKLAAVGAITSLSADIGTIATFQADGTGLTSIGSYRNGSATQIRFNTGDASGMFAEKVRITESGNVGIGTSHPTDRLSVNGTVRAKEVIVETTGWSDYVFGADYNLPALLDVERQIRRDGHLPGIPSAREVSQQGIGLGEMQAKLLAKVEEITLHLIEEEKRMQRIEQENATLRNEVARLERDSLRPINQ